MIIESFHDAHYYLSNFYENPMKVGGKTFKSNEHFFQASKAGNPEDFEYVRASSTPSISKKRGREIKMRGDWDNVKNAIMTQGLRAKFTDPELRQRLLDTGDATLIEGNRWHDCYWGRCDCSNHGGDGQNWLGRLLMQLREELRKETP